VTRPLRPGARVDRYRVELPLGEGGMATVYRVRHERLGTVHALKVLHIDSPAIRERLLSEGRAQARLSHDNVVAVTDILDVDGAPALLMEFVDGGSLADVVSGPPLGLGVVLDLFAGVVRGVAAAHAQGIVHRDLKPGNVLLALYDDDDDDTDDWDPHASPDWSQATPKVTDFGLAKVVDTTLDAAGKGPHRTAAGIAMGTPAFMAPEQIRDARGVDHRADLFALGALLYAMLTGRSPFSGPDRFAVLTNVTSGRYPALTHLRPDAPDALVDLVDRCLAVAPEARPGSADALLAEVELLLDSVADQTTPPPAVHQADLASPTDGSTTWDPEAAPGPWVTEQAAQVADTVRAHSGATRAPEPASEALPDAPPPPVADATLAPGSRGATVLGLVVDRDGRGHVVELVVVVTPGGEGVRNPTDVDRDASVAAQLAVAVALGPEADRHAVRWAARGAGFTIHGTSLGLAIAVATRAAFLGRPGPTHQAFTGGLDLDGRVASVHGVPAKVRAAAARGIARVAVPAADVDGLPKLAGTVVEGVARFQPFAARLLPVARKRRLPFHLLALLVPIVVAIVDGTSALDAWLHHPVLALTRGRIDIEDVLLVTIPTGPDLRERRADYPALFDALAAGGATAVFFDIALSAESPHDDAIAAAVRRAREAGLTISMPVRLDGERSRLPGSAAIAAAATLGVVEARQDAIFGHVRAVPVRRHDLDGGEWWHLAVHTAAAHVGARRPPALDGRTLVVGPLRNPTFAEEVRLPPVGRVPQVALAEVASQAKAGIFTGKAVVVGVTAAAPDLHRTPDGVRSGAEIEAGVVQVLLRQAGVHRVEPELDALFAGVMGLGTWGLGVLAGRRRWLAGVVPLAGVAVFVALAAANRVVAPGPALLGLVTALVLLRRQSPASPRS